MQKTDVVAQKINSFFLEIYSMVIAAIQIFHKLDCLQFFQKTFLLIDISMQVIFVDFS